MAEKVHSDEAKAVPSSQQAKMERSLPTEGAKHGKSSSGAEKVHGNEAHAKEAHNKTAHGKETPDGKAVAMKLVTPEGFSVRGAVLTGLVVSAKAPKTVTVERIITKYVPKYERYKKIKSRVKAHNPESLNAKEGDMVLIGETRKLSKTKNFVVMQIMKRAGST